MNTSLNWIKAMVPGLDDVTDQQFRVPGHFQEQRLNASQHMIRTLIK